MARLPLLTLVVMLTATIKQALVLYAGPVYLFTLDSVPLLIYWPVQQLWPMSGLFLLDVNGMTILKTIFCYIHRHVMK